MDSIPERVCSYCGVSKPVSEFYAEKRNKKDGKRAVCRLCEKSYKAIYHKEHKEEKSKKNKLYYKEHLDQQRGKHYKRLYGITIEEYKAMYKKQNGKCAVCGEYKELLRVDHNHKTGKVRDLLCNGCNTGLGQLKEDVGIIERLKDYVLKHL